MGSSQAKATKVTVKPAAKPPFIAKSTKSRGGDKSRVVVSHIERETGARGVKAILALDGQRQLGLVAGQAQRQEQLDTAAVKLRHRERVASCGAVWSASRSVKNTARLNENDR